MNRQPTFDTKRFIQDQFGGTPALLEQYPYWSSETVYKWVQRQSIPGQALAVLLSIVEARDGQPLRISSYLEGHQWHLTLNSKPEHTGAAYSVFD